MLELRELIVYPIGEEKYVVIAGNMRLRAMKELGHKFAPCKILPKSTPVEKLRAYTIKDNVPFGENDFDVLANEWDHDELEQFGMDVEKKIMGSVFNSDAEIPEIKYPVTFFLTKEDYEKWERNKKIYRNRRRHKGMFNFISQL
jgi:hypothetical protein